MEDGPYRTSSLRHAARRWLASDREAALLWLSQAELSPELRQEMLSE